MIRCAALFLLLFLPTLRAGAAPPSPPEPALYQARIRYQITAYGTSRIRQYDEMATLFRSLGFRRDPDDVREDEAENPAAVRMKGVLPAGAVPRLAGERHVRAVLLIPEGAALPEKDAPVRVDLSLRADLSPERQRLLAEQTAEVLAGQGFREAVGYDTRGGTRLLGTLPSAALDMLLEDLRRLPGAEKVGPLFRSFPVVIQVVRARPDLPLPRARPTPPVIPPGQERLSPELRDLLSDAGRAEVPTRMEVLLSYTPALDDRASVRTLTALPGLITEGRLGPLVSVRGIPKDHAVALAALPTVVAVRLPRTAQASRGPGREDVPEKWTPLEPSGLARLHAMKRRGQGVRVALVAADFTGWETLRGRKEAGVALPDPVLVDFTRERNPDMQPDPYPLAGKEAEGPGTRAARALLRAAPEVDLTLLRIDAAAPYMVELIARAVGGEVPRTLALEQRLREIQSEAEFLEARSQALAEERKEALNEFRDDDEPRKRRAAYEKGQEQFEREDRAYRGKLARYVKFLADLRDLRKVRVVANTLVWGDGYPVDGSSPLSRLFDDRPFHLALWFQAAGDTRGQAWSGPFRDSDGNGVVEFAPPELPLTPGRWTRELNFLGWQARPGAEVGALPAGARVRVSVQWREPHDPLPLRVGEDVYREPLNNFQVTLLYQPDPEGKKQPADDLDLLAESAGVPQRLVQTASSATYEQVVELKLPQAGRYAVRIQGRLSGSVFAPGENRLPATRQAGEIRPRLFVHTLEGPGRAVWVDFATAVGSLGMPADATRVITVGAADRASRAAAGSADGPPYNLTLLTKPDVLAYGEGAGTETAAGFAAGLAATAHTAGVPLSACLESLRIRPGEVLRVPETARRR